MHKGGKQLLEGELNPDAAGQIALRSNPDIQALFEDIGISQADVVQAGLLQNPIFDGMVRFPDSRQATINTQFSLPQNFLELFLIPLRTKMAEAAFEQARVRVANTIQNLA